MLDTIHLGYTKKIRYNRAVTRATPISYKYILSFTPSDNIFHQKHEINCAVVNISLHFIFNSVKIFLIVRELVYSTPFNTISYLFSENFFAIISPKMRIFIFVIKIKSLNLVGYPIGIFDSFKIYVERQSVLHSAQVD